jgi:RNA polymerase sigma-70 factor (ECF subfamily)
MHDQLPNLDPSELDPSNWVSEHGDTLYAYAMSRLKNADAAEDVVQEALLGGLKNLSQFPPQNEVGPWLMGILKKKVVDRQRQSVAMKTTLGDADTIVEELFDKRGKWSKAARSGDPLRLDSIEQSEFMGILKRCLKRLPPNQAAVFVGRELNERNSEDLCKELGVSSTNLWVLMHRARLRLAECIRAKWSMGEA